MPMRFEIHAHRGARSFFPENTLPAFLKAVELGVDAIELDLCVSQDRKLVVSHDPFMAPGRCIDPAGFPVAAGDRDRYRLYGMTFADIVRFDCGLVSGDFPGQRRVRAHKPRLEEVFGAVEDRLSEMNRPKDVRYNLEVKSWARGDGVLHPEPEEYAGLVCASLERAGVAARALVQSFDTRILREVSRIAPDLALGLLVRGGGDVKAALDGLGFVPDYLNPRYSLVSPGLVASLHALGVRVVPWTVNDLSGMRELVGMGVDGIITDVPEVALDLRDGKSGRTGSA